MGGMSGGKGGSTAAPDFTQAAEKQAASSQQAVNQQTTANRANQTNALGASTDWTQGANGQWTQNTSLGGQLGTAASNLEGQVAANSGKAAMTGDQARDQAITGAYNQATSRLDPQWQHTEETNRAQLLNQGLDPDSQAYQQQMGTLSRQKNDAYSSAMNSAIGQGTQAQQATFSENQAAQNQPYQQLQALQGMSGQSNYNQAGQAQATQYSQAAQQQYQGQQNQNAQQQAGKNSTMSGIGQLGSTAAMAFSDERLKVNIHRLKLEAIPGVPFARWEWKDRLGEFGFGVIAQDLMKVAPKYVSQDANGYLKVDYSFLEDLGHD